MWGEWWNAIGRVRFSPPPGTGERRTTLPAGSADRRTQRTSMMMNDHTAKAFDVDLHEIARLVAEMGGLAEKQVADSIETLSRRDVEGALRVVSADNEIDRLQRAIEEKSVLTIARRQPMAVDLRQVIGALRISNDLERIGDLAKNISKR